MTATSLDLSGRIDPVRERVFRDVAAAAAVHGIRFFVVGACARDILLDLHYGLGVRRATNDIDFGVRVESWDKVEGLRKTLTETGRYTPDTNQTQRLRSPGGAIIDVIPFGGVEVATTRTIAWPPDDSMVMSTLGFEEASRHAVTVRVAPDLEVDVSSLAGLTLMKLVAWKDRHLRKDAQDLKFILSGYLGAGNRERLESGEYADLLEEDDFISAELAGARLLGRDLGSILTDRSRRVVFEVLDEPDPLASNMAAESFDTDEAFGAARSMLDMLRRGILDIPT